MDVNGEGKPNNSQHSEYCKSCKSSFSFKPDEAWFDEKGFGYSTKLVKCKNCGKIVVVKHMEDKGLDVNLDRRFYK